MAQSKNKIQRKQEQIDEIIKCGKNPSYFIKTYVKIPHPVKGLVPFKTFPYQDDCLEMFQEHRMVIVNKSRQLGLSTISAAYSLWLAIFYKEKNIIVIATKLVTAQEFIVKVKAMLDSLPSWLIMPTLIGESVKHLKFSNGSRIQAMPTSKDAGRSQAASVVIIDECAHIENFDSLWTGLQPTISCVSGDTLILTDNGFIPIEDFHAGKNTGDYFDLNINVFGKNGLEKTSHGYVSPESETLIFETKHGHKIECTKNHPLYVLQDSGVGKMIYAKNLALGNHLRIGVGMNVFGKKEIHNDMAYMLGGYIAEGWITKRKYKQKFNFDSIEIENSDEGFRNVFLSSECLEKKFRVASSRKTRLRCSSRKLINQFFDYGIDPFKTCYTKTVPKIVLEGNKSVVVNYLSGYFDGDGNISERSISAITTSERLARQTSLLLHNLGFVANVSFVPAKLDQIGRIMPSGQKLKTTSDAWTISIPRSQYFKFASEIGFRIQRKQDALLKYCDKYIQNDRKLKPIPKKFIKDFIIKCMKDRCITSAFLRKHGLRTDKILDKKENRSINADWLLKFKDLIEKEKSLTSKEIKIFNENIGLFYWDEIVSIKKSNNKTYDFTVPKTHTFLQNGILGSNTGGSAILISTPLGVGGMFHKIWIKATDDNFNNLSIKQNKEGSNKFYAIELPWTVHPERDEEWYNDQCAELQNDPRRIAQELLCNFNSSGNNFIDAATMDHLKRNIKTPIARYGPNNDMLIWAYAEPGHDYIISADVARGDADDYSAFWVIDATDNICVAEFKGKIPPDRYGTLLLDIGEKYNNAFIVNEINNVGIATSYVLKASKYKNLYYEKLFKGSIKQNISPEEVGDEIPGFNTNSKSRNEIMVKFEAALRNHTLTTYSERLIKELDTFIWDGKKAKALKGYNDDLILSLSIGTNFIEFNKKSSYSNDEFAKAMIQAMSSNRRTLSDAVNQSQQPQQGWGNAGYDLPSLGTVHSPQNKPQIVGPNMPHWFKMV